MIRVSNIKVPLDFNFNRLKDYCTSKLRIPADKLISVVLARRSVDARKKSDVHFNIALDICAKGEGRLLKSLKNAAPVTVPDYKIIPVTPAVRPVIIGFGPAGMFAALVLAMSGAKPIVIERGSDVDSRVKAVEEFQSGGRLDPECNVQFGEGGAGTFSDGKLNTGISDQRIRWIFQRFVEFGAPEEILWQAKPHIGTDKLRDTVRNLRKRIIALGGEVHFDTRFTGYSTESGRLKQVECTRKNGEILRINTNCAILATGHSARDVFEMLYENKVELTQKNFAVGVRIEHRREDIDRAMYGDSAGHPALKAADYKLAVHLPNGRALYTFCMCPGGSVVAASSEEGHLAVNGMSCFARDAENSNSALLVGVGSAELASDHPLAGMYFQRDIEEKAFIAGGSDYHAPAMTVGEFLGGDTPETAVFPSYRPGVRKASPEEYLPGFICETLRLGIPEMGRKIPGFDSPSALLTGVESRSSSPVRIVRDNGLESVSVRGFFPCGEGAGYAGGIVSAAVDGMKCAEAVINLIANK